MTELSHKILGDYQVRKTNKQKTDFIELIMGSCKDKGIPVRVEKGGIFKSRNIIAGELETARIVVTAHYDTPAGLPFPNFITPKNPLMLLLYNLLILLPFIIMWYIAELLIGFLPIDAYNFRINMRILELVTLIVLMCVFLILVYFGKANRNNANDNTSGVVTLCELIDALPPEQRDRVAFVFFDNEELGMVGSSLFRKVHKMEMMDKVLFNLDCVSDGDHIMLIENGRMRKLYGELVRSVFTPTQEKQVHIETGFTAFYPSDHWFFPIHTGIAALRRKKGLGLYLGRIHTSRDTCFDETNISFIKNAIIQFVDLSCK